MTAAATPTQVISDQLVNPGVGSRGSYGERQAERDTWARDILAALAEAGYAVVSVLEPGENQRELPVGAQVRTTAAWTARYGGGHRLTGTVLEVLPVGRSAAAPERTVRVRLAGPLPWPEGLLVLTFDSADLELDRVEGVVGGA